MSILLRAAAAYMVLVAAAVAVHFIITPLYHPGGDAPFMAWEVMNWFMSAAMLITLAAAYAEKRLIDGDSGADMKRYLIPVLRPVIPAQAGIHRSWSVKHRNGPETGMAGHSMASACGIGSGPVTVRGSGP